MARKFRLSSFLYKTARRERDMEALASGNPERILRRQKNKAVGRLLGRAGVWRKLWR